MSNIISGQTGHSAGMSPTAGRRRQADNGTSPDSRTLLSVATIVSDCQVLSM